MPGGTPTVVDRFGNPAGVENLYLDGHVFMILGGPSRNLLDQSLFALPGVLTFAVNNVAAAMLRRGFPPAFWTYGDTTWKFHDAVWKCPNTLKFSPQPKLDNPLGEKRNGEVVQVPELSPRKMPGVLGIYRNTVFDPAKFLTEETVNWGVGKAQLLGQLRPWLQENAGLQPGAGDKETEAAWKAASASGKLPRDKFRELCPYPKVLTTMFQAIRLCYLLGFRQVYLVGCDFTMSESYRYSFEEVGNPGTVGGNNNSYEAIKVLLAIAKPHFEAAGFQLFNLNPESMLTAFPYLPFEAAVARACKNLPRVIDTQGWYEKKDKKQTVL